MDVLELTTVYMQNKRVVTTPSVCQYSVLAMTVLMVVNPVSVNTSCLLSMTVSLVEICALKCI